MMSTDITSCVQRYLCPFSRSIKQKNVLNKRPTRTNRLAHLCYTLKIYLFLNKWSFLSAAGQQFNHPRHFDAVNGQFDTETKLLLLLLLLGLLVRATCFNVYGHTCTHFIEPLVRLAPSSAIVESGTCRVWTKVFYAFFTKLGRNVVYTYTATQLLLLFLASDPSSLTVHCLSPILYCPPVQQSCKLLVNWGSPRLIIITSGSV